MAKILSALQHRNLSVSQDNHRPVNPASTILNTPWWGFQHDGYPLKPFWEYCSARGYEMYPKPSVSNMKASLISTAVMYQSWLSFGLIEAVIERSVPESMLLYMSANGTAVMSSIGLRRILQDFESRILQCSDEEKKSWHERASKALISANRILFSDLMRPRFSVFYHSRDDLIDIPTTIYMLGAIGEALRNTSRHFSIIGSPLSWTFTIGIYPKLKNSMITEGWCPAIWQIPDSLSATLFANMFKPVLTRNGHRACTPAACVGNTIDEGYYVTKHTMAGCGCSFVKPPVDTIISTLEKHEIPVVSFELSGVSAGDFGNLIVSSASDTPYVAISHVWADGIGSWTEKGLPNCQLQRISAITSVMVPGGAFWMDSLCVPNRREVRRHAIGLMGDTYRKAAKVLVLDTGIRGCSVMSTAEEILLRVFTSGWMQRLWTLQEGVLAKELVFELSDGCMAAKDLIRTSDLWVDVVLADLAAGIFRISKDASEFQFSDVTRALKGRSTSRAEDETLAIASLLHVDALKLVNLPPDERMMALLSDIHRLPSGIIFTAGPKLQKAGFRWAPTTLMAPKGSATMVGGSEYAICTQRGLVGEYRIIFFKTVTIDPGKDWFIHESSKNLSYQVYTLDETAATFSLNALLLQQWIGPGEHAPCIAVMVDDTRQTQASGDESEPDCEFRSRIFIKVINRIMDGQEFVSAAGAGRMKLRLT